MLAAVNEPISVGYLWVGLTSLVVVFIFGSKINYDYEQVQEKLDVSMLESPPDEEDEEGSGPLADATHEPEESG